MVIDSPFNMIEIEWVTPLDVAAQGVSVWDKIRIYRSSNENAGYNLITDDFGINISEIDSNVSGAWVTNWDDPTKPMTSKDGFYYLVRYYNSGAQKESKFYLTFKTPSPKEQRFIEVIKGIITPWISQFCTDDDIRGGIILAMNAINVFPPQTSFDLDNFPTNLEPFLTTGAACFALMFRYLGVAITDMSYSDMGFSLNIDRGAKVKEAMTTLLNFAGLGAPSGGMSLLALAKMDYAYVGGSVGTIQLPISLGGNMNKGMLNVLDLLTSLGR